VAVVKADAYGHGLQQVAGRLMHAGADLFAVANITEAAQLRELGPGWPILLLSPLLPDEDRFAAENDLAVTVSTEDEVARLDKAGRDAGREVSVHLKIDTGMGRLGVWHEEAPALVRRIKAASHLRLSGVFTHFASPDDDAAFTEEQRRRFLAALDAGGLGSSPDGLFVHADNSSGLETMPGSSPFNAVRVGLLQFGVLPHPGSFLSQVRTEPVFSFRTRVGIVKRLPAGTTVSYGRTRTLSRESRVAVLCAGYGDGIPRAVSNKASVLVHGVRCPVLGRVTMDQTVVDVTGVEGVASGDEAVLVGRQGDDEISVGEFSRWADTIPWETLCSVTKRVPRVYRTALGM
jgi:alanine racemase